MITVPELVWSGVAGALAAALIALITTWLNNRGQNRRQKEQLQHDSGQRTRQLDHDIAQRKGEFAHDTDEKRLNREMSLKRDVYLEATSAIGKLQEFIGSYPRDDISEDEKLSVVKGCTASLNKVHIVGSNQTIEAFSSVQAAFVRCNRRLGSTKLDLVKKNIDLEQLRRKLKLLGERRQALLQLARNIGPNPDPDVIAGMRADAEGIDGEVERTSESLDGAQDQLFRLQLELLEESISSNIEMLQASSEAVLVVREELRLGLDVRAYRKFIEVHQAEVSRELREFISDVRQKSVGGEGNE